MCCLDRQDDWVALGSRQITGTSNRLIQQTNCSSRMTAASTSTLVTLMMEIVFSPETAEHLTSYSVETEIQSIAASTSAMKT